MPGPTPPRPYRAVQADRDTLDAAEAAVTEAARRALTHWLTLTADAVLQGDTTGLTAAADPEQRPRWQLWPAPAVWVATVTRFLTDVLREVFTLGWRAVMGDRADPEQPRDTYVDAALDGLAESTFPDDVYDAARQAQYTAENEGDTTTQMRERVAAAFDPDQWAPRADTIGRTEANGAYNTASWEAGNARQDLFGEQLWRTWIATNDQRTRDSHRRVDGAVAGPGESFTVGGAPMRYPHDPLGPIGEWINCRCSLGWIEEEEVEELQQRYEAMLPYQTDPWGNPVAADAGTPENTTTDGDQGDGETVAAQSGMPKALRRYWTHGEGALKIRWGTDGAFNRCVRNLNEYVSDPKGTCANLEHEATGHWPAEEVVESAATNPDCGCDDSTTTPTEGGTTVTSTEQLTAGVSGAADLPLAGESVDWSGSAAKKALGNWAKGDASKLRKGFFWHDPDGDPTSVSTYKLPFAKPVNGELKAVPAGVMAAAAAIQGSRGGVDIPQADVGKVRSRIAGYYKKMGRTPPWKESGNKAASAATADVEVDAPTVADDDEDRQPRALTWAELVASSVPAQPPEAWFTDPELAAPMKVRVFDNGMVVGHIAAWHTEHASLPGVNPPRDPYGGIYPRFHRHGVRTAEGTRIKTGPLSTGPAGHADLYDPLGAVIDHYDDPSFVAADVRIGEDAHGIWVSGALRPGVSPEQVWMLDRYSISGDWRDDELVAACTVAVPGFHLDDSEQVNPLAASAALPPTLTGGERSRLEGEHTAALVAAGIIHPTERHAPPTSAVDGWSLYRAFKAAATTDRRLRAARHRLHGGSSGSEDGEHDPDPVAAILAWNPALHPRDAQGRFTDSPGGGGGDSGSSSVPDRTETSALADALTMRTRTARELSTEQLRAVDAELADRAAQLGKQGQLTPAHKQVRQELAKRPTPQPEPSNESGLSDAELENRIGHLQRALSRAKPTDELYQNADETWNPQRARQHDEIINDLYARAADVPNEGRALVSGGLGGAGKSWTLKNHLGLSEDDYLTVNPDDVKEEMAQRGMIPDLEGLSPMEASSLVHEESSHIAKQLAKRAYQDNKNVIWDITMGSPGSVEKRLNDLRANGYDKVSAVFVDIPIETSVARAMGRYERGIAAWNNGKGHGGRYVPPEVIRENHAPGWTSENRKTFEQLKPRFDAWALYDSTQLPSKKVDGRGEVN